MYMNFLSEIEPIVGGEVEIHNKSQLKEIVELPILAVCEGLWDKNIKTCLSSANKTNIGNVAQIVIDYDTLSDQNKEISERIGEKGTVHGTRVTNCIYLNLPISQDIEISFIAQHFMNLISQFKKQPLLWGYYNCDEYLQMITGNQTIKFENEDAKRETAIGYELYYDVENDRFYLSEELYQKSKL